MQQSQASQVHKELQDTMAQLEAIRHEIRSISIMNPGPLTRRLVDDPELTSTNQENSQPQKLNEIIDQQTPSQQEDILTTSTAECSSTTSVAANMESQAIVFASLAASQTLKGSGDLVKPDEEIGLFTILPVFAESSGLLLNRNDDAKGSDFTIEAVVEAEVAQNAKQLFAEHQNQIKFE